jgi:hypothetical protein
MSFNATIDLGVIGRSITGETVSISGCTGINSSNECTGCTVVSASEVVNTFPKLITGFDDNHFYVHVEVISGDCIGESQCIAVGNIPTATPTPTPTPTVIINTPTPTPTVIINTPTPTPTVIINTPTPTPTQTPTPTSTLDCEFDVDLDIITPTPTPSPTETSITFNCNNGNCEEVFDGSGLYSTLSECQNNCTQTVYSCKESEFAPCIEQASPCGPEQIECGESIAPE